MRKIVVAISSASASSPFARIWRAIAGSWLAPLLAHAHVIEDERAGRGIETDHPAGRDDNGRVVLVDQERPAARVGAEARAWQARHLDEPVAEVRTASARGVRVRVDGSERCTFGTERDHAKRAHVDRRTRFESRAVEPLVLDLEALDEACNRRLVELAGQVDRDAPALTAVAHVGDALPLTLRRAQLGIEAAQLVEVGGACVDPAEANVVLLVARDQQPGCGEQARERRHDRRAHAELGCERRSVHGARAAVGDQDEVARGRGPSRSRPRGGRASSRRSRGRARRARPRPRSARGAGRHARAPSQQARARS